LIKNEKGIFYRVFPLTEWMDACLSECKDIQGLQDAIKLYKMIMNSVKKEEDRQTRQEIKLLKLEDLHKKECIEHEERSMEKKRAIVATNDSDVSEVYSLILLPSTCLKSCIVPDNEKDSKYNAIPKESMYHNRKNKEENKIKE